MTVDTWRLPVRDPPSDALERTDRQRAEAEWVVGIRSGSDEAFTQAFRAFVAPLMRYAHGFVSSETAAQDIVMDVFLKLWRDRRSLPGDLRLGAYLHVAVRNTALNALAHARVEASWKERGAAEGWSPAMGAPQPVPDAELERAEAKEALRRAYVTLPARLREVIELRWFQGRSYQEIAREMHVSVKSVDNYLTKGMRLLRAALKEGRERSAR